jgi:hypothetical protein
MEANQRVDARTAKLDIEALRIHDEQVRLGSLLTVRASMSKHR